MNTIAVIGGGASGLIAALTAAENKNNKVILFERQARVGKKLLATGNGRCNLTNTLASLNNYHGADPSFVLSALNAFPPEDVIEYFRSLGLLTVTQYGGRVYPLSDSANSVLDVLRFALDSARVEQHTSCEISRIEYKHSSFVISCEDGSYSADKLIIACGGKAGGKLGGSSLGYELLKSLGHHCTKIYPSLVPVTCSSDLPRSLKGVRAECEAALYSGKKLIGKSSGEIQFTEKGVSGPVIFDLSRSAAIHGGEVSINFFNGQNKDEILELLHSRVSSSPELEAQYIFAGMLHSRIGLAVIKYCSIKPSEPINKLKDCDLDALISAAMDFRLPVKGTGDFDAAQVTAGGIDTSEFDSATLESRLVPGLYACGEVLDIDADCGGYNLQWAWASGRLAGRLL